MALTVAALNALKPREKSYKRADGRGLYIQVMPNGSKLWRYKYRLYGLEKRLSLGSFPEVSLADARKKHAEARAFIEAGQDPAIERKKAKLVAALSAKTTFLSVAREFIEQKMTGEGRAQNTIDKSVWFLELLQPLHALPVGEIKAAHVLGALKRIEAKGKYETARRCRSFASRVFRYAVATLRAENDPASLLRGALLNPRPKHHAAIERPEQVADLLRAIDQYAGHAIIQSRRHGSGHRPLRPDDRSTA